MTQDMLNRIVLDPQVMLGKPVIRGTRIPVELVVRMVGQGISIEEILSDYPRLKAEDVQAALLYAASVVAGEDIFPLTLEPA